MDLVTSPLNIRCSASVRPRPSSCTSARQSVTTTRKSTSTLTHKSPVLTSKSLTKSNISNIGKQSFAKPTFLSQKSFPAPSFGSKNTYKSFPNTPFFSTSFRTFSTTTAPTHTTVGDPNTQTDNQNHKVIDFLNHKEVYKMVTSTQELIKDLAMYRLCASSFLVNTGMALMKVPLLGSALNRGIEMTFFPHFCAGEKISADSPKIRQLQERNIGTILDGCVEDAVGEPAFKRNQERFVNIIRLAGSIDGADFVPLKPTALCDASTLETMTTIIQNRKDQSEVAELTEKDYGSDTTTPKNFELLMQKVNEICEEAAQQKVRILVDAEQSFRQPAIRYLTKKLMEKHNTKRPMVYHTYQMYLKGMPEFLREDLEAAKAGGYFLGAKVVRGAHINSESELYKNDPTRYPIVPTKAAADLNYNEGIQLLIENTKHAGLFIATHNRGSIERAVEQMHKSKVEPGNPNVCFGQLQGMAHFLSLGLAQAGYRVFKLLPFGPPLQVMPYLIRRIQENRDVLSGTREEIELLDKEIRRRVNSGEYKGEKR